MVDEKPSLNQIQAIINSTTTKVDDQKRKRTVCVHWLRGQCKKNENCEFLHVYQEDKIPPCKYYQQNGECQKGEECVYRHIPNEQKRQEECPYYERGFCKRGYFDCQFIHMSKKICENYLYGFCPLGPNCDKEHLKTVISEHDTSLKILALFPDSEDYHDKNAFFQGNMFMGMKPQNHVICHRCGKEGHKSTYCQEEQVSQEEINEKLMMSQSQIPDLKVLCFKCKKYGHYANLCPTKQQTAGGLVGGAFGQVNLKGTLDQYNQMIQGMVGSDPLNDFEGNV
mmetsp:Transcript_31695/g.30986  ORF Transcript_31695/g.30986 Transcript_31695/m.30986 type:complete len:282 (+) Transcript_31695:6-851(+)